MNTYIIQTNAPTEIIIIDAIPIQDNDLIYSLGGGFADGTLLKVDNVIGNKNVHSGNTKLSIDEIPVYKKCDKVSVTTETITVESASVTRGLFKYQNNSSSLLTFNDKSESIYYWDEVYTTPIGYFTHSSNSSLLTFEFNMNGNIFKLLTNDLNIVPKIGDYVIFQKLPTGYIKPTDIINISPTIDGAISAGIFTDGLSNLPVIMNTETYQLKITDVTYNIPIVSAQTYNYDFLINGFIYGIKVLNIIIKDSPSTTISLPINTNYNGLNPTGPGSLNALISAIGTTYGVFNGTENTSTLTLSTINNTNLLIKLNYQLLNNAGIPVTATTYEATITKVNNPVVYIGLKTKYTIILDKSLTIADNEEYSVVLLNRENTGLQKELFYDTFEQIEVQRTQLLGDPYFETSSAKPNGRKNFLYYNGAQYLGIKNLLSGVLKGREDKLLDTPFIVYDIDEDIRDRFCTNPSSVNDYQFEFHLPNLMLQEDTNNKLNVLVNYGAIQTDTNGSGKYSGLYLRWQENLNKRLGFIFYDLRIIVIDDPELATALSYNSNRNYTLPKIQLTSPGNITPNNVSTISLDIVGLQTSTVEPTVIIVNGNHNLQNGDVVSIVEVKTKVLGSNLIHLSDVNGIRYIKRYYSNPADATTEILSKFYIYTDQSLTTSLPDDGVFVNSGIGQSGRVKGAKLKYNYFITYRIKNNRYHSIAPYGELINFNFATTSIDYTINNNTGAVYISLLPFTFLNNGYQINDLEFIIGEWEANNSSKPYEMTGFKNVVVLSSKEVIGSNLPSNVSTTNFTITKSNYNSAVSKIGNGLGSYDFTTNLNGDRNYDIFNNYKHYNIINGTLSKTLNTGEGKWTLGNITYKTEVDQFRSNLQIVINANEWNDTMNPSYDPDNEFITSKYISEIAICDKNSEQPIIYTKIAPPIKKTGDLDVLINLSIDF